MGNNKDKKFFEFPSDLDILFERPECLLEIKQRTYGNKKI